MTLAWWLVIILASGLIYTLVLLSFERRRSAASEPARDQYYAGLRSMLSGDQEAAFQRFKDSVRTDSRNVDAYLRIGDLLRGRGQAQKALSIHRDLAQRGGLTRDDELAVQRALAEDLLALNDTEEALEILGRLSDERETEAWALTRLHRLRLKAGQFEEAYKLRRQLSKLGEPLDPATAALYLSLAGLAASERGEHRRGRVLVRDGLKANPSSAAAHYYLGELYARDHRPEDAVRSWKTFLEHSPQLAGLVFPRLEKVLFEMGQYSEIAGVYQQVLAADPVNTEALLGLARFSEKKGDHQLALGYLERILEIDPGHLIARQLVVQIHRETGDDQAAWQAALGFFTWLPGGPNIYRCSHCAQESREPRWFCSSCHRFNSFDLGPRRRAADLAVGVA